MSCIKSGLVKTFLGLLRSAHVNRKKMNQKFRIAENDGRDTNQRLSSLMTSVMISELGGYTQSRGPSFFYRPISNSARAKTV